MGDRNRQIARTFARLSDIDNGVGKNLRLLEDSQLFLNDRTLRLSPYVDRLWLHDGFFLPELPESEKPSTKLILTDFGWNQPKQGNGKTLVRSIRQRQLIQAVIDHPLFDPNFKWSDLEAATSSNFSKNLQYFAFMDVETCFESNYPNYEGSFEPNFDSAGSRKFSSPGENF
jgi:hypothetical protein